jgi:hypothetical protein
MILILDFTLRATGPAGLIFYLIALKMLDVQ